MIDTHGVTDAMMVNFPNNFTAAAITATFSGLHHPPGVTETTYTTPLPSDPCLLDNSSLRIPLAVLYTILFILGLAGNILALWALFRDQSKKNSVRVFLINTALADLLLVACLPFRVLYHSKGNHWDLG
ncbi:hypothetical protein DPEC_G00138790, partial [Dallia pectoralis]